MSDLFGNHIVGFPTRRLICELQMTGTVAEWFKYCLLLYSTGSQRKERKTSGSPGNKGQKRPRVESSDDAINSTSGNPTPVKVMETIFVLWFDAPTNNFSVLLGSSRQD